MMPVKALYAFRLFFWGGVVSAASVEVMHYQKPTSWSKTTLCITSRVSFGGWCNLTLMYLLTSDLVCGVVKFVCIFLTMPMFYLCFFPEDVSNVFFLL